MIQESPAREFFFPEEEHGDELALAVDVDEGQFVGQVSVDAVGVDVGVGGVGGEDGGFAEGSVELFGDRCSVWRIVVLAGSRLITLV